jgi:soluble lytic murein transglycosylase-like protein
MAHFLIAWMLLAVSSCAGADCFDRAAARFGHNANLLRAIAEQESNHRADALGPLLPSGHRALGTMQVNSIHLPELARYKVTREDLMTECGSVFVGAWIFARYVALVGPRWQAVGIYNTGPQSTNYAAQARYIAAVKRRFERIERTQRARRTANPIPSQPTGAMTVWGAE